MVTFSYRECDLEKWQMSQRLLTKPCVVHDLDIGRTYIMKCQRFSDS